jgi:LacI family transcriptional regulator, galactose operon repressor
MARTIGDIARLAGVSKATVSRVLNNKPDVDPATRERILRIIEEENFVPSFTASNLASGHNRFISMLMPTSLWNFLSDVIKGVAEVISLSAYQLVLHVLPDTLDAEAQCKYIENILAMKLTAGLLAFFPKDSAPYLEQLYQQGFPVVILDDQRPLAAAPWIGADNKGGAYIAVQHLLRLGHRHIAHISLPQHLLFARERYQGYCQALEEAGIALDPELVVAGDFPMQSGQHAAEKLFHLPPERRPTAIFASLDMQAYGVIHAAQQYGLRIPDDIALVGFDDNETSLIVHPSLTTIRQPRYEMGQRGVQLLLSIIEESRVHAHNSNSPKSRSVQPPVRLQLPMTLVVRDSSQPSQ